MNIIAFFLCWCVSGTILICWMRNALKKPIKIEYHLEPREWFGIHGMISFITMVLMTGVDVIYSSVANIQEMPLGVKGIVVAFIQNGGLIIFVMLCSSVIYNHEIKAIEFEFFVERYEWVKKVFYSIIGVSVIVLYIIVNKKNKGEVNILADEYQVVMIWMIVVIQIWIGFGMKSYKWRDVWSLVKDFMKRMENGEERRYLFLCLVSMLVVPVSLIVYFEICDKIPGNIQEMIKFGGCGAAHGTVCAIVLGIGLKIKYRPCECISKGICNKIFRNAKNESSVGHFKWLRYELSKTDTDYILVICEQNYNLECKESLTKGYIRKCDTFFKREEINYSLQEYAGEKINAEIKKKLKDKEQELEVLLKEGWDMMHEFYREKEKKKNRDIIKKRLN